MKQIKSLFLCAFFVCSIGTSHFSFTMNNNENEPTGQKSGPGWIVTIIVTAIAMQTVGFFLNLFTFWLNKEENMLKKIESLLKINKELENNIKYIRKNCRDKELLKKLEEKYTKSSIALIELQNEFLEKYGPSRHNTKFATS